MKKLMIAFAAAFVAVCAHAHAVNWQWTATVYNGYLNKDNTQTTWEGKAAQGGTMYIFNAAGTTATSQSAVYSAILAGTDISTLAMDSYTTANGQMSSSRLLPGDYGDSTKIPTVDKSGTPNAAFFYAMLVTDASKNSYVYLSDTFNTQIQSAKDTTIKGAIQNSSMDAYLSATSFSAGGWYSAAPEPTSGLLLLLGMGALALRRRRA